MHTLFKRLSLLLVAATLLAGCAGLLGPRQVDLPLYKLQAGLDKRFPFNNRILELFDIELTRPQLSIQAGSDRLALSMDASVSPPFTSQSWRGSLALSGRLVLDTSRNAVFLQDARVEHFDVEGIDGSRQRQVIKVGNVLMDRLVRDTPLYTFRPDDLRYGGVQFVPTRISTTSSGLQVTVEPAR
jgi:hypothetical protein